MSGITIRPACFRGVLAAVVIVDLLSFYFFIGEAHERVMVGGLPIDSFSAALASPAVRALVIAIGIAGAVAFARAAGRLMPGLLALIALVLLSTVHARLFGSPWRHLYYSGLCLLGWLIGSATSRVAGAPSDESYARIGSTALLGAAYFNAGISKIVFGGVEWMMGLPIQAVVVAQDGLVRDGFVSAYRSWVVMSPTVLAAFSLATVVFELAGPLMVLGGWVSVAVALGLFCMHLNIYLLTAIVYWESMLLLVLFGVFTHDANAQPQPSPVRMLASRRTFTATALAMAVVAVLAIGHQRRRYHSSQHPTSTVAGVQSASDATEMRVAQPPAAAPPARVAEEAPAPPPTRLPTQRIGPFSIGDRVTDEWVIEALNPTDGGFTITILGPAGHARFEINCADAEHRSPFDVGSARIFYSPDLAFPILQPLGRVLRERVQTATAPHDPCAAVKDWTRSAG